MLENEGLVRRVVNFYLEEDRVAFIDLRLMQHSVVEHIVGNSSWAAPWCRTS